MSSKPAAKTSVLAFTTAQTVHKMLDLQSLAVKDKEPEKEEDKPFSEPYPERAPLDLVQRSSVVSLLADQRREGSVSLLADQRREDSDTASPGLGVEDAREPSRRPIVVTSGHSFPAFGNHPTYLVRRFTSLQIFFYQKTTTLHLPIPKYIYS